MEIVKLIDNPVHLNFTGGITPKGVYAADVTYNTGESVSYLGSSYVAIQESTGNLPTDTTYWQLLSLKGNGAITGGTTGQVLAKASNVDFDNEWKTLDPDDLDDTATTNKFTNATQIENWNTAYGWGDHAGLYDPINSASNALSGHLSSFDHSLIATALQSETDPVFTAWDKSTGISITESQISDLKTYIQASEKGANSGVATLDNGGKIPAGQLPSLEEPLPEWVSSNIDTEDATNYYFLSFIPGTTKWRINRLNKTSYVSDYAIGDSDIETAWTDRASQTYAIIY